MAKSKLKNLGKTLHGEGDEWSLQGMKNRYPYVTMPQAKCQVLRTSCGVKKQ
jgi:hypothetical protein